MGEAKRKREHGVRLYHTTTADRADSIMREGFLDHPTVNKRLFSGTTVYPPGVWFSDIPALDDELFDGVGLFDFDAEKQAFIAVDARLRPNTFWSSDQDYTWPGTQYWAPAALWNEFPRLRLSLDEVIRLRLATDPKLSRMQEWIEQQDPRPYGTAFHARVKRILAASERTRVKPLSHHEPGVTNSMQETAAAQGEVRTADDPDSNAAKSASPTT